MGNVRPSWDDTFMAIAAEVSKRSTCLRRQVGAVVVKDNQYTEIGYNGAPTYTRHCTDIGHCLRDELKILSGQRHEICRGAHGDGNAIARAGKEKCQGATLYIYGGTPCGYCAKLAINNGISRVVCCGDYPDDLALELLREAGIVVDKYEFAAIYHLTISSTQINKVDSNTIKYSQSNVIDDYINNLK